MDFKKTHRPTPFNALATLVQAHLDKNNMASTDLLNAMGYSNIQHSYQELRNLLDSKTLNRKNSFFHRLRAYFHNSAEFNEALRQDEEFLHKASEKLSEILRAKLVQDFKPQYYVHHEYKNTLDIFASASTRDRAPAPSYLAEEITAKTPLAVIAHKAQTFITKVLPQIGWQDEKNFGKRRYVVLWYAQDMNDHKAIAFDLKGNILTQAVSLKNAYDIHPNPNLFEKWYPYVESSTLEQLGITPPVEKHSNKNTGGGDYEGI